MRTRSWVAVLAHDDADALLRRGCEWLALDAAAAPRPSGGDRITVLSVRPPRAVEGAVFVALADVAAAESAGLRLRRRVTAPARHGVLLGDLPSLRVGAGWTHQRLAGLVGTVVPCTARDLERVAAGLLARAREYGPPPKRPAHARPRTPGRRHALAGRLGAGRL